MRYEMLSLLGAAGLGAWSTSGRRPLGGRTWMAAALVIVATAAVRTRRCSRSTCGNRRDAKLMLARQLEARGVRYATSDYWIAYAVTFLTNEKTKIASTDLVRIREYNRLVESHPEETIRISREPCPNGHRAIEGIYFCNP
jgi:hypothetical protein